MFSKLVVVFSLLASFGAGNGTSTQASVLAPGVLHRVVRRLVLSGAVPAAASDGRARRLSILSPSTEMAITVSLRLRHEKQLDRRLALSKSPLSLSEANARFNPLVSSERDVIQWLRSSGMYISGTYSNRMLVDATGRAASIEAMFSVHLAWYQDTVDGQTRRFFASSTAPVVPARIAPYVSTIVGLDNYPRLHRMLNGRRDGTPPYYPQDFADAYDLNPLWNTGFDGQGERIGIVNWGVPPSDATLSAFASRTGATVATRTNGRLKIIPVDGGSTTSDDGESRWTLSTPVVWLRKRPSTTTRRGTDP